MLLSRPGFSGGSELTRRRWAVSTVIVSPLTAASRHGPNPVSYWRSSRSTKVPGEGVRKHVHRQLGDPPEHIRQRLSAQPDPGQLGEDPLWVAEAAVSHQLIHPGLLSPCGRHYDLRHRPNACDELVHQAGAWRPSSEQRGANPSRQSADRDRPFSHSSPVRPPKRRPRGRLLTGAPPPTTH